MMTNILSCSPLAAAYDAATGDISGGVMVRRRLSDLKGCFTDTKAFEAALNREDPLVYSVSSLAPGMGDGDLHYGLGILMPGKVGAEYYMTKGHYHTWRESAEVYIGLRGHGAMLLEDENSGESRLVPLNAEGIVYVPGHTAHRSINTGLEPLVYIGVYPARAGHDYEPIAKNNFHKVVIERDGQPVMEDRTRLLRTYT